MRGIILNEIFYKINRNISLVTFKIEFSILFTALNNV